MEDERIELTGIRMPSNNDLNTVQLYAVHQQKVPGRYVMYFEPDPKPSIEIPAGWVECDYDECIERRGYAFTDGKWVDLYNDTGRYVDFLKYIKPTPGFEGHGAAWWAKQPEEVVCIALDTEGDWYKYDKLVNADSGHWWHEDGSGYAKMWPSEHPKNFTGDWKDSLMVRPDRVGEGEG